MIPKQKFYNPGRLPEGLEVADLLSNRYRSQPRNKQIADVFKDMGEIEKYGSGIGRVMRAFLEEGLPAPEWQQISSGILVTVYLNTENVTENRVSKILEMIKENPGISTTELAARLSVSKMTILRDIEILKSTGRITRIGPSKGGYWKVRTGETN